LNRPKDATFVDHPPQTGGFSTVKVFVLGDGDIARYGLCSRLNAVVDIHVVGDCRSDGDTLTRLTDAGAQLMVVQSRLRDRAVITCARRLRCALPALPLLLAAARVGLDEVVLTAVATGARGYVPGEAQPAVLAAAVRRVAAGAMLLTPNEVNQVIAPLTCGSHRRPLAQPERELLTLRHARAVGLRLSRFPPPAAGVGRRRERTLLTRSWWSNVD
jgi:DNA-binding NarL/FixJ family response regulator